MRTVTSVKALREALTAPRRAGATIGLVPTMGAFHEGHLSLMRRARQERDLVVVSLFVNPTQFDDPRDFDVYPRDEAADVARAAAEGVDVLFAPPPAEIYPVDFATHVTVDGLTERLEGASRGRGHFTGVTTVVTKLLNMVGPDVAYFGQKDAQQAVVIKRLVRDLDLRVSIEVCPIVRDTDGLALSSRNAHLSAVDRQRALALSQALALVTAAVQSGERDPHAATAPARTAVQAASVELEYLELVDPETFVPVSVVEGAVTAVIAGRVGATRLIDNTLIEAPRRAPHAPARRPRSAAPVPGRA
ncbi:MAG: pantoate--beta-alanine ligase [Solirubrobacteraceae bacterium]